MRARPPEGCREGSEGRKWSRALSARDAGARETARGKGAPRAEGNRPREGGRDCRHRDTELPRPVNPTREPPAQCFSMPPTPLTATPERGRTRALHTAFINRCTAQRTDGHADRQPQPR